MRLNCLTLVVLGFTAFISFILAVVAAAVDSAHQWQCEEGLELVHVNFNSYCIDPGLVLYNGTCDGTWKVGQPPQFLPLESDAPPYLFGVAVGLMVAALGFAYKTDQAFI